MEKKATGRELESVANLFISSDETKQESAERPFELRAAQASQAEDDFEVEETITVRKKIAYPATQNAQSNIRRCLNEHLQDDYIISRIELRRSTDILTLGNRKSKQEEVVIFLKPSPPH
ncbi:MAG: hypothetical protein PVJ62_01780 [Deltaproteobacteria bacterium]|jgi:hypothetical protein